MEKVKGIIRLKELGLPTPKTIFIKDFKSQLNEVNNFLLDKDYVMIRSDKEGQSTHCPRNLKCLSRQAKDFIKELNNNNYVAILQEYVPLNNHYSGNVLVLNNSFIIEAVRGGPTSKLNRDGLMNQHLRIEREGGVSFRYGEQLIPEKEIKMIVDRVRDLPKYNIYEFSRGPDWFYFWQVREDPTSKVLD